MNDDAAAVVAARNQFASESIVSDSHFSLTLLTCPACGGQFLGIFFELIDWAGGDDSQAWFAVPMSDAEIAMLRAAGAAGAEAVLPDVTTARKYLSYVHPRGGSSAARWQHGAVPLLPHD